MAERRRVREHNERVTLAWFVEALSRSDKRKRLPKLETMLAKMPHGRGKRQSMDQQIAMARAISATVNAGKRR